MRHFDPRVLKSGILIVERLLALGAGAHRTDKALLIAAWLMLSASASLAQSQYSQLTSDTSMAYGASVILSATVTMPSPGGTLFVNADGSYFPIANNSAADMFIQIDGQQASNDSVIDWRGTSNNEEHAFNCIGAKWVGTGSHTVSLVASDLAGAFTVAAGANLTAMKSHATTVVDQPLPSDIGYYNFTTQSAYHSTAGAPATSLSLPTASAPVPSLTAQVDGTQDVVLLASGRSYVPRSMTAYGDAMWGFFSTTSYTHDLGTRYSTWGVNDLHNTPDGTSVTECQAPMYIQAFLPKSAFCGQTTTLSMNASEFPWARYSQGGENPVQYAIGSGTRLVYLRGGMQVRGSAPLTSNVNFSDDFSGPGGSPPVPFYNATPIRIAYASFYVPDNHNGVVFFSAADRVYQDINSTGDGVLNLWIEIDRGQPYARVGPRTVQGYLHNNDSMRTLRASYLADQNDPLERGGWHTVELFAEVYDNAGNGANFSNDLPLLWFD
jgi:hypothetical protein